MYKCAVRRIAAFCKTFSVMRVLEPDSSAQNLREYRIMNMSYPATISHEFFMVEYPGSARGHISSAYLRSSATVRTDRPRRPVHDRVKGWIPAPGTSWARALQRDHRHVHHRLRPQLQHGQIALNMRGRGCGTSTAAWHLKQGLARSYAAAGPVTTPRERMVRDGQILRQVYSRR